VIELAGSLSVAAGPLSHDLAAILHELGADADSVRIDERSAEDAGTVVSSHPGRRPVVVVHDVDRHPWQVDAVVAIVAADGRAVVVDAGYPAQAALPGARTVTTFGSGRASLTAAAELLLGL
jgi:hypothetical protein